MIDASFKLIYSDMIYLINRCVIHLSLYLLINIMYSNDGLVGFIGTVFYICTLLISLFYINQIYCYGDFNIIRNCGFVCNCF